MKVITTRLASFVEKNAPAPVPEWAERAIEAAWKSYYVTKHECLKGI